MKEQYHISGLPGGVLGSRCCADKPGDLPAETAVRESLRNCAVGYWIGGAGYEYRLRDADIIEIAVDAEPPAIYCRDGRIIRQCGTPAIALVVVRVPPADESRELQLEVGRFGAERPTP